MRLNKKEKRVKRNRSKLKKVNYSGIRVSVNKSQKNIFAQVINDNLNKTIVSASTLEKSFKSSKGKKTEMSAKRAIEKKITAAVFDRGGYKYHGIIKVFAETLRKQGMKI